MNNYGFKFNLGDLVKDNITNFEGIVTARHQWLSGCNTYTVQPQKLKDGVPQETVGFDEPQLENVDTKTDIQKYFESF